jgi:hypothetical protein
MLGHASAAMTLDVYADLFDQNVATGKRIRTDVRPRKRFYQRVFRR